jgi:hypothetical protein
LTDWINRGKVMMVAMAAATEITMIRRVRAPGALAEQRGPGKRREAAFPGAKPGKGDLAIGF